MSTGMKMSTKKNRRSRWLAALVAVGPLLAIPALTPSQASARCDGNSEINNYYLRNGQRLVYDRPIGQTCDGDTLYSFNHEDGPFQDERCSYVHFHHTTTGPSMRTTYTCSNADATFDDDNTTTKFRFQTSGYQGTYSVWNTGTGH